MTCSPIVFSHSSYFINFFFKSLRKGLARHLESMSGMSSPPPHLRLCTISLYYTAAKVRRVQRFDPPNADLYYVIFSEIASEYALSLEK